MAEKNFKGTVQYIYNKAVIGLTENMFELDYRIVHSEYDDFAGQHGFFQIKCNNCIYGEMYPKKIEEFMDKVSIYDWFERLAKVIKNLMEKDYVALSDVESYNTWLVFQKRSEEVIISIVKARKEQGSHDIEFSLINPEAGEWMGQIVGFEQLKQEILIFICMLAECSGFNIYPGHSGFPAFSFALSSMSGLEKIWAL